MEKSIINAFRNLRALSFNSFKMKLLTSDPLLQADIFLGSTYGKWNNILASLKTSDVCRYAGILFHLPYVSPKMKSLFKIVDLILIVSFWWDYSNKSYYSWNVFYMWVCGFVKFVFFPALAWLLFVAPPGLLYSNYSWW